MRSLTDAVKLQPLGFIKGTISSDASKGLIIYVFGSGLVSSKKMTPYWLLYTLNAKKAFQFQILRIPNRL